MSGKIIKNGSDAQLEIIKGVVDAANAIKTTLGPSGKCNKYLGHRMVIMCGEAPEFQRRIRSVERKLAGYGLDGLYMDMICNCMGSCWNPAHRHAPGGGKVLSDGYRSLLRAVKADNPAVDISSEEEGEAYLDVVDSLIVLYAAYERLGKGVAPEFEMLPVFQMLYHASRTTNGTTDGFERLEHFYNPINFVG